MTEPKIFRGVVIGASTGGPQVLARIFPCLPNGFPAPIVVVVHRHPHSESRQMTKFLGAGCRLTVKEAEEKESLLPGTIYLAPANYHLLLETDGRLALSIDPKVKFSRPSIDVLFESAAAAFREALVGIVLTGASSDGADGLREIKRRGGHAIVQDPKTAEAAMMPKSALASCSVDQILTPEEIGQFLAESVRGGELRF